MNKQRVCTGAGLPVSQQEVRRENGGETNKPMSFSPSNLFSICTQQTHKMGVDSSKVFRAGRQAGRVSVAMVTTTHLHSFHTLNSSLEAPSYS